MLWVFLLAVALYYIRNLLHVTSSPSAYLRTPVSRLSTADISILIFLIVLKYPFKLFRLLPHLTASDHGFLLPKSSISAHVKIDKSDIQRYQVAVKNDAPTTPLLIPGLVNPLLSIMLASRNSPVLPFGCVNTSNRFMFLDTTDPLSLESFEVTAFMGGFENQARRVKRGMEFDIYFNVTAVKPGAAEPTTIFKQIATVLMTLPSKTQPLYQDTPKPAEEVVAWHGVGKSVKLGFSAPDTWAALCKDYNPIHMSGLLAKLFGFSTKIAHGNHVLACALAQLEPELRHYTQSGRPFAIDVSFKRPMPLPTEMDVEMALQADKSMLRVTKQGKEHLVASVSRL